MKYEVDYFDPTNGATSPIDTIEAPFGYTVVQYIEDCRKNADQEYVEMLERGEVTLVAITE